MAFHWRADDGPLLVVLGSSLPSSTKKRQSWTPLTKLSGSAHAGPTALSICHDWFEHLLPFEPDPNLVSLSTKENIPSNMTFTCAYNEGRDPSV